MKPIDYLIIGAVLAVIIGFMLHGIFIYYQ